MINCSKWFRLAPLVIHNLHKIRNRSSSKNENSWHPSKDHENSWKKKLCMVDERIVLSPIFSVNQLIWCEWFMHRLDIASLMNLNMSKILVCFSHKDMEYATRSHMGHFCVPFGAWKFQYPFILTSWKKRLGHSSKILILFPTEEGLQWYEEFIFEWTITLR